MSTTNETNEPLEMKLEPHEQFQLEMIEREIRQHYRFVKMLHGLVFVTILLIIAILIASHLKP